MPQPVPSWLLFAGLSKESAWGTAVAPATFYPSKNPKVDTVFTDILDDGYRSNASKDQGYYQGEGHSEIDLPDIKMYPDDAVHFLMAMLGADAVTGAGPYTHTITLLNTALPPSYTVAKYDAAVATARQAAGVNFEEVQLKFANPGIFNVAVKGRGKIPTNATKPTAAYSSAGIYLPWQAALTIAGGASTKLIDMELTLKRKIDQIWGIGGTQDVSGQNVDVLEVAGKLTFVPADYTEYNYYVNNTQPTVSIVFTSGTNTLTLQMSKVAFVAPTPLDSGSPYLKVPASFRAIANSTDAGVGNAPLKVIAVNSRSAAY